MASQNYANHRRYVILYHVVTFSIIVLLLISSLYYIFKDASMHQPMRGDMFFFLISLSLLFIFFFARVFSLKAQDRAIRAEENFRHFLITGKPLDSRLTIRQIIGLRFASDEEFSELAKRAVDEKMKEDDIKKAIKNWKPDFYRV